jgi:hypothetical protein
VRFVTVTSDDEALCASDLYRAADAPWGRLTQT